MFVFRLDIIHQGLSLEVKLQRWLAPNFRILGLLTLRPTEHQHQDEQDENYRRYQQRNLPEAVGPVALYLAGAAVDDNLKDLLIEAIGTGVNRQQQVLECDPGIMCDEILNPLLVPADGLPNIALNHGCGDLLHSLETLREVNLVTLSSESR